ncbi:folate-binding protein YgfZ [Schaalia sp. 19OD2882]|uniref:CAF17-like 4Fe-4S cluster assembly/insertion protein YgfZ n=1 Tax=Schaalia sp. 19OD2882 TaxID=2794089 RepID=UPI001C1EDF1A|nr:folate-binding protein [Schaalia sp. 19OD2882]QWW19808.1 folate-binding protein YgfZ [Schaalia sp. 19OD2882]
MSEAEMDPSSSSVLATWPGAVLDKGGAGDPTHAKAPTPSVAVPLHHGDPAGEQWALEAGRGLVDRSDLGIVRVDGPDRQRWLTSLTSQVIEGMGPADSRELLILDPQGHVEHAAAVVDDGASTWLVTEGFAAPALAAWLDSMRFMLRVEVAVDESMVVLGTVGAASLEGVVGAAGHASTWADPWPGVVPGGTEYHQGPHPAAGVEVFLHLVHRDSARALAEAWLGGADKRRFAGLLAWEAIRIACWRPRLGYEVDSRTVPAEVDWLRTAVHTHKGCYRGQESVARILNLGRPPRRLVMLQLDGSRGDLPEVGAAIERSGRRIGTLTSVARHADMGPIALALLARNVPGDLVLDLGGIAAAQELIIPIDGRAAASPAERPGAELREGALRRPDVRAFGGASGMGAR